MRVIQLKLSPILIYLIVLFFYGTLMMLVSLSMDDLGGVQMDPNGAKMGVSLFIQHRRMADKGPIRSVEDFFNRLSIAERVCRKMREVGGITCKRSKDNSKMVCFDEAVRLTPKNCTIYSFGIGEDMTFDELMHFYGCKVIMFDPTIPYSYIEGREKPNLVFYPLGLATRRYKQDFHWMFDHGSNQTIHGQFMTFSDIQKRLNMENKSIDYFKMDIDGLEWSVIPYLIEKNHLENVKQFAIEIHVDKIIGLSNEKALSILNKRWVILQRLKTIGFQRVSYVPTIVQESLYYPPNNRTPIPTCGELLYIKKY